MTDPTYLDPARIREEGILQEANRRFFHPLGLAMAVDVEEDRRGKIRERIKDAIKVSPQGKLDDLADTIAAALAPLGLPLTDEYVVGLLDATDDPEGYIFALPETLPDGRDTLTVARDRAARIDAAVEAHAAARLALFPDCVDADGAIRQPIEEMTRRP